MHFLLIPALAFSLPVLTDNNLGLPEIKIPANNPQTIEKIALGRDFFHDARFSSDGLISCASCHQADKAFTDGLATAKGINGKIGFRNSPTILNAAFFETLFLDGRTNSLEQQALGPFLNPIEHGLENKQKILDIVLNNDAYKNRLKKVFNISEQQLTVEHIVKAIASFERTLIAGNSAFDQYYFGRDKTRLTTSAARGLRVFRRKGNCANCHEISWNNALFSDNRFYNIGVGFKQVEHLVDDLPQDSSTNQQLDQFAMTDKQRSELGRFNVTKNISDIGKFKTPTLRNIALTAPYMHNGSMQTLEQVVDYYNKGGDNTRFIDPAIFPLNLNDQEKSDLVAFMKSLTSPL